MEIIPEIKISDYDYPLPRDKIAAYPLSERDKSKLLVFKGGVISDCSFNYLHNIIPKNTFLVFNNTRVIYARLLFQKASGAKIEIFCLEPVAPFHEVQSAMQQTSGCRWKCLVGNASRWKQGQLKIQSQDNSRNIELSAEIEERSSETFIIHFFWEPADLPFSEILEIAGKIPLPPYIKREAEPNDSITYQTVFANQQGSVAAPTAGLHFTPALFENLQKKNIETDFLTLHVGAGTFKPVSSSKISEHVMHAEQVVITLDFLEKLYNHNALVIAVGTTSVRSLESLFFVAEQIKTTSKIPQTITQWVPYGKLQNICGRKEVLELIIDFMKEKKQDLLQFNTEIIIIPGYKFKMIDGILTNFHQPRSTLLLLIAAYLGDSWKKIYEHALTNNYRFLSYGDACLFLK